MFTDRLGPTGENALWKIMYKMNLPLSVGQESGFVFLTEDDMHDQAMKARKIYFMGNDLEIGPDGEERLGGGRIKKYTRKKSNRRKPIKRKSTRRKTIKRKSLRRKSIKRKSTKKKSKKRRR